MTNDEIINIARIAGWTYGHLVFTELRRLTDFAALIAAAEREACADIADQHASIEGIAQNIADAIRARGNK